MQRTLCCLNLWASPRRAINAPAASSQQNRRSVGLRAGGPGSDLPPELADLRLTEDGLLVDEKTGEVINEYGATRFDVAVRALRGDFDPPPGADNTERAAGLLLDSLVQWPARYDFQFVLRSGGAAPAALTEELRAVVAAACQSDVAPEACTAKERKGGKYVSVTVPCTVRAPQLIQRVFDALEGDDRVIMKY